MIIMTTTDQAAQLLNVSRSVTRTAVAKKKVKLTKKAVNPDRRRKRKRKRKRRKKR